MEKRLRRHTRSETPFYDLVRRAPKVVLHDHLDGGLRPQTMLELAAQQGYRGLPAIEAEPLAAWIRQTADQQDLSHYLEPFAHTVAMMQDAAALRRVAYEAVVDLAQENVIYAEIRFAPQHHVAGGLSLDAVIEAVQVGVDDGTGAVRAGGKAIRVGLIVCGFRAFAGTAEVAAAAVRHRDAGVIGFDLAGPEDGYPPSEHLAAFAYAHENYLPVTIHAGEGAGLCSIHSAVQLCGARRIGHGVRIVDDIRPQPDGKVEVGPLAVAIRDCEIPLEVCVTSNIHTGAVSSIRSHPIRLLRELGFKVTLNTDNRLMSGLSMTSELMIMHNEFGYKLDDLEAMTIDAMDSAFCPVPDRQRLIEGVIRPGYAALKRGQRS